MKNIWLILFLFLFSCSSLFKKPPRPETPEVFPNGFYEHDIQFEAQTPKGLKEFNFNGVITRSTDRISVTGLAYGFTAFKIVDDLKGNIKKEIVMEDLKKSESQIDRFYAPLRTLILLNNPTQDPQVRDATYFENGLYKSVIIRLEKEPIQVNFTKYDEDRIPMEILLSSKNYNLTIRTTNYRLKHWDSRVD